jgi:hypothetical protein
MPGAASISPTGYFDARFETLFVPGRQVIQQLITVIYNLATS